MRQDALEWQIPPIELWPFIVQKCHVNVDGKHLLLTSTLNEIRKKWSTNIRVGGIHSSYVEKCLRSCAICDNVKLWDEVYNIPHHLLDVTLDKICTKYMVFRKLRRSYKCKGQIVKYYHCHRSGSKKRHHRKSSFISLSQEKDANQDMKSRLCGCSFQLKTVEAVTHDNSDRHAQLEDVTISVHTQHT